MIRNTLGIPSTDLGTQITRAKEGGKSGVKPDGKTDIFAFNIKENGGAPTDGTLIKNALPYFNIWSQKAPGSWTIPVLDTEVLYYRLKRDSSKNYMFSLGDFAGYNHEARHPRGFDAATSEIRADGSKLYKIYPSIVLGGIDWRILDEYGRYTGTKVAVQIATDSGVRESEKAKLAGQSGITFEQMSFYINTSTIGSFSYKTRAVLYSQNDIRMGYLPESDGEFKFTILREPPVGEIRLVVDGYSSMYTLKGTILKGDLTIQGDFEYHRVWDDNPKTRELKKITYTLIQGNTGEAIRSIDVTSWTSRENPKTLYATQNGLITMVVADLARLSPIAGQWIVATFYYE